VSESTWHRVDEVPDEGRVRTAIVDGRSVALSRCGGRVGALDNHCPHQGGPLGEGSIENGLLRCPWHGYDYDPTTGRPPAGFSDAPAAYPVQERGLLDPATSAGLVAAGLVSVLVFPAVLPRVAVSMSP
jgi:nitrite reductase/ring-hydroxylating ferredoxin subunit